MQIRVRASALNHMDLWVTKGMPKPPLPHVPGCDVAGVVEAVGDAVTNVAVGDEVVVNPGVSPVADIVALGNDSPMGDGFMIYGEHCWGGHADVRDRAEPQRVRAPGQPHVGGVARPTRWRTSPRIACCAERDSAPGRRVLVVGVGGGVSSAALALARHMGAKVVATSRSEAKRARGAGDGRRRGVRLGRCRSGRCRPTS